MVPFTSGISTENTTLQDAVILIMYNVENKNVKGIVGISSWEQAESDIKDDCEITLLLLQCSLNTR